MTKKSTHDDTSAPADDASASTDDQKEKPTFKLVNHLTGETYDLKSEKDAEDFAKSLKTDHWSVQDNTGKTVHSVYQGKKVPVSGASGDTTTPTVEE